MKGFFDITTPPYNATGDGNTDDAPSIQLAVTDAVKNGGVVWVPPGRYRIASPIVVSGGQAVIAGASWAGFPDQGSWLIVDKKNLTPLTIDTSGRGTVVRDIAFDHKQPDPAPHAAQYAPIAYPHALLIRADDVLVSNVFFLRPARAIAIHSPTAVGRVVLDRIWGWPLLEGIRIDTAQDTVKVRNVHFWPFWSPPDPANPTRRPVEEYVAQKGEAIVSERNDNPHFSDIFCLGYKYGFHFSQSTAGKTSKFRIANADLDHCKVGLQVSGNGVTGQLVNFTTQGWRPSDSVCGIRVEGDDASIQATNVRITSFGCNGIRVEGKSAPSLLLVDNLIVDKWDLTQRKFPAVEGFGRGQVKLGRMFIATGGGLPDSPATGGDVTRA